MLSILLAHNYYQQPGGEDRVFEAEARLLESYGHRVTIHTVHNDKVNELSRLQLAARTVWSQPAYAALADQVRREKPDVVHFHNTLPLLSPSVYYAARRHGAAVVQTLHNYRLICPGGLLMRNGAPCETCVGAKFAWRGVAAGCYRTSRSATAVVAGMLAAHRAAGTWARAVDLYIALTEFAREKFIAGGLPAERMVVKPNFLIEDPGPGAGRGGYALFVGRLTGSKGIQPLLDAWALRREAGLPTIPLKIVGDGPMTAAVREAAASNPDVDLMGHRLPEEVSALMAEAACLIVPSLWYEGLPTTIIEAFSRGTPVVASELGAMQTMVEEGRSGLRFTPGDAAGLAACVDRLTADDGLRAHLRRGAREAFEAHYTAPRNYEQLIDAYEQAVAGTKNLVPA